MQKKSIPYCPLMSAGKQVETVCAQERCAWFLKNYQMCSVYIMAHNAAMEISDKQNRKKA